MKIYGFFKNLGLCALATSALPMIGSSRESKTAQYLSNEAALESGRALTEAAAKVENFAQDAEQAAQDAEQSTTLEQAQEASRKAYTSWDKARQLKDVVKAKVKEVQELLEQLKVEATNTNQLAVYPIKRANEQIAEVEKIAQKAQEEVNRALSASSKASDAVDAKKKAATAAPVVVHTPSSAEKAVPVTYDQSDVKWYDDLLDYISAAERVIDTKRGMINDYPNASHIEYLEAITAQENKIKGFKEKIETTPLLKAIAQDRAKKKAASAAPVVARTPVTLSAPEVMTPAVVTPAQMVALQPAQQPEPTPWADWYLDLPSSSAAAAKAKESEAEEPEEEEADDEDQASIVPGMAESTEAETKKLYEDLRFQHKDHARLESAPHKSELTTLSIKNAEKKIREIENKLASKGLTVNLAAKEKQDKAHAEIMERSRLMPRVQKESATPMPEETEDAEEIEAEEEEIIPSPAEPASDKKANVGSDSHDEQDAIRSQRPLYTPRGALTPEGHVQRLEQRQAREEAQRRSTW